MRPSCINEDSPEDSSEGSSADSREELSDQSTRSSAAAWCGYPCYPRARRHRAACGKQCLAVPALSVDAVRRACVEDSLVDVCKVAAPCRRLADSSAVRNLRSEECARAHRIGRSGRPGRIAIVESPPRQAHPGEHEDQCARDLLLVEWEELRSHAGTCRLVTRLAHRAVRGPGRGAVWQAHDWAASPARLC